LLPSVALRTTSSTPQSPSGYTALHAAAPAPHCTNPPQTCHTDQQRIFARPSTERAPSRLLVCEAPLRRLGALALRATAWPISTSKRNHSTTLPSTHPPLGSLLPCTHHRPEEELALGCCVFGALLLFFVLFRTVAHPVAPRPRSVLHRRGLSLRTARRRLGSLREDLFGAPLLLLLLLIAVVS